MSEYAIEITDLTKKFGDLEAVKGIDLKINEGEIFGLLGPNGAGKTTILNMVLGLLRPTSGRILVEGLDISKKSEDVKQMIGFMTQETVVDSYLTARDNLRIAAELYHIAMDKIEGKIEMALDEAGLTQFGDKAAGTFSGGMQRRLNLVKSMIQEPKILILDEPTTGLDVQSRMAMWGEIRRLNRNGITIILTTQYLEEADTLCDRIAIVDHGSVKAIGTASELKRNAISGNLLEIVVKPGDMDAVAKLLKSKFGISAEVKDYKLRAVLTQKPLNTLIKIASELDRQDKDVITLSLHLPTLDDVFIKLTGASFRDTTQEQASALTRVRFGRR